MSKAKRLPKVFDYFQYEDPFAKGLSLCAGCPLELLLRFVPKVLGKDIVIVGTPSCSATVLYGQNLDAWHDMTSYGCLMTGVASSATGITRYYRKMGKDITVVCFTGDGCAADIGFQPLSGAAERNENFIYICYDNEGYMNTGIQRSSTTPIGANTTTTPVGAMGRGKGTVGKNLPYLMAMHKIPYAATATLSHLEDLAKKLTRAKEKKLEGFAYLHIFSPCPTGWGFATDMGIGVDPKWKEISWDEALNEIAARMKKILADDPNKILISNQTQRGSDGPHNHTYMLAGLLGKRAMEPLSWVVGASMRQCGTHDGGARSWRLVHRA